jgi:hypothetical protein
MSLQQVYNSKDSISNAVRDDLAQKISAYGYDIIRTLLTEIQLPASVSNAMNSKKENEQLKLATVEKSEAHRIATVVAAEAEASKMLKLAEAQAEVDRLKGKGLALQRMEVVRGLDSAVRAMSDDLRVPPERVLDVVLSVQYFDTLRDIGHNARAVMVPFSSNPHDHIRTAFMQAEQLRDATVQDLSISPPQQLQMRK